MCVSFRTSRMSRKSEMSGSPGGLDRTECPRCPNVNGGQW